MDHFNSQDNYRMRSTNRGFNSTYGNSFMSRSTRGFNVNNKEQEKLRTLKKMIEISSIDKNVMKILIRYLERRPKVLKIDWEQEVPEDLRQEAEDEMDEIHAELIDTAKKFLETDKVADLERELNDFKEDKLLLYDRILKVFEFYIISPIEKDYVLKIHYELERGQELDNRIKDVNENIKQQKIERKEKEKNKLTKKKVIKESVEALLKEIEIYENKIEKANQKLNENMVNNQQLREKIDQLRKDKLVVDQIYKKLEEELKEKQESVERTIKKAGEAYIHRNSAEEELKMLKERAQEQKDKFEKEMTEINKNIQHDKRFKEFILNKSKEKQELEALKLAIEQNKQKIKEKTESNSEMEKEYNLSAQKENEIKEAFERIKNETGINDPKDLLKVFQELHEKTNTMEEFVSQLSEKLESLDQQIVDVKKQIDDYKIRGAAIETADEKKRDEKTDITKKIEQEEKRKLQYKAQYEKLIETLSQLKNMIENTFVAIGCEDEFLDKIRNSALTEENMVEFIGALEKRGLDIIGEYSRLLAEQIKLERENLKENPQVDDLNNIIAYENAQAMTQNLQNGPQRQEITDDVTIVDNIPGDKRMTEQELRQSAIAHLNNYQSKRSSGMNKTTYSSKGQKGKQPSSMKKLNK